MNRLKHQTNLEDIAYLSKRLENLKKQANIFIPKFKKVLDDNRLTTSEITTNSFDFSFWGLDFTIKVEIEYSPESHNFMQGELNTYLENDEKLILIISSYFDELGNVGRISVINDFAEYYFIDFVENLKKLPLRKNKISIKIMADYRDLEFLAEKAKELLDRQISSYRTNHTKAGTIIGISSVFIPIFLFLIENSSTLIQILSFIPIIGFLYSIVLMINILRSRPLDQGFNQYQLDKLVNQDYESILLYEIGAKKDSITDNEKNYKKAKQ